MAAGLTGAYAPHPPNVELVTLVAFGSGVLLGAGGAAVAGLMECLYALLNPWGPVHPVILGAQVAGMALVALGGALFARLDGPRWPVRRRALALGAFGALLKIVFDVMTNVATGLVFGQVRVWLLQGMVWTVWGALWDMTIFAALGTPLTGVFAHYRARLSSPA